MITLTFAEQRGGLAPDTYAAVLAAVPLNAPGATPKEIHDRVGCWSRATVRRALSVMLNVGVVRATGQPGSYRYWRSV
jgi:DNA-binding IclR family transcriptional regulator